MQNPGNGLVTNDIQPHARPYAGSSSFQHGKVQRLVAVVTHLQVFIQNGKAAVV